MSKKQFSKEFKQQLVDEFNHGSSYSDLVDQYGIGLSTIQRWVQQSKVSSHSRSDAKEIKALKKQLAKANTQNEILKKALAIFTKNLDLDN